MSAMNESEKVRNPTVAERSRPDLICRWCGTPIASDGAVFCAECKSPVKSTGYIIFAMNFSARNLLLPLVLGVVTFLLANHQQKVSATIEDGRKLSDALTQFGRVQSALRRAQVRVQMLISQSSTTVPADALRQAVIDYDKNFDLYEPTLAPFEEFDTRIHTSAYSRAKGQAAIDDVWKFCYLRPYYGYGPNAGQDSAHWEYMRLQLQSCSGATCPVEVARNINETMWEVYSGTCACKASTGQPPQLPMEWFWLRVRALMSHQVLTLPPDFTKASDATSSNQLAASPTEIDCPTGLY